MAYNKAVEAFKDEEYPMMKDKVYLDHGGTTIYAKSLIDEFSKKMIENLYGNPHSASDPAKLSGDAVDSIREKALAFFNADPEHFDLIFTANATASIKLVADGIRDLSAADGASPNFWYGYHKDAHTSIVGVRELSGGTHHCFGNDEEVDGWLNGVPSTTIPSNETGLLGLFAYPGQSNMTGRRLPLSWPGKLRASTKLSHQNTYSLLDAAALATTTQLDYSNPDRAPDFTALSFYKIFGFPDLGGLIVRKKSGHILSLRKYFGGGTVTHLTVNNQPIVHRRDGSLHEGLEDGTLPFHSIIALGCAMDVHRKLYGSMRSISKHTSFLAYRLYMGMTELKHYTGESVCIIYNDVNVRCRYGDPTTQGATVSFNVLRADGSYAGHTVVEKMANDRGIYLRSGGLCNSGGIADYLHLEPWQMARSWSAGHRCGVPGIEVLNGKPTGVVRASLGAMTTIADVDKFLNFLVEVFVEDRQLTLQHVIGRQPPELAEADNSGEESGHYYTDSGYCTGESYLSKHRNDTVLKLRELDQESIRPARSIYQIPTQTSTFPVPPPPLPASRVRNSSNDTIRDQDFHDGSGYATPTQGEMLFQIPSNVPSSVESEPIKNVKPKRSMKFLKRRKPKHDEPMPDMALAR